jgi:GT2 family glycosyltransferase
MTKTSVIIPTYKRPARLKKCVESLLAQSKMPDEIIIVARPDDAAARKIFEECRTKAGGLLSIKFTEVTELGIICAENHGLKAVTGDIVCFLDDDAVAPVNWIDGILGHYDRDPSVGAVGGPVVAVINGNPVIEYTDTFSRMTWFGKRITNSAMIPVCVQEVDLLRGANMSFRRGLLTAFDERLLPYWRRFEDDVCLAVKEKGYRIICDPKLMVSHYGAETHAETGMDKTPETIIGLHHNSIYIKLKHIRGLRKIAAFFYEFVWGDVTSPGFCQIFGYGVKHRSRRSFSELGYAMIGKVKGAVTYFRFILSGKAGG